MRYPLTDEQKSELREQAIMRLQQQLASLAEQDARFSPELRQQGKSPAISEGRIDFLNKTVRMLADAGEDTRGWWASKDGGETHNRRRRSEYKLYPLHRVTFHIEIALSALVPDFSEERNE